MYALLMKYQIVYMHVHVQCTSMYCSSLVPRPLPTPREGPGTHRLRLYPESGYIVYSRKIFSKLSI